MTTRPDFLENSIIIGAHPDDELLWFNSILRQADKVVIVFCDFWAHPGLGAARKRVLAEFPHPDVHCLGIDEPGSYGCADWVRPTPDRFGLAFRQRAALRDVKRQVKRAVNRLVPRGIPVAPGRIRTMYETNYTLIRDRLRPLLRPGMNLFTHNPWGEYGHEDHVQVFRVLQHLQREIGFQLWMSNYCTERSLPLATRYFRSAPDGYIRLPADKAYADQVADLYRKHGCWTWADDWSWFDDECFMKAPAEGAAPAAHRHLMPLNLFTIEDEAPRSWFGRVIGRPQATAGV
ncbi:hypothetical protein CSC94_07370 [Zhengella mangrovi]|uniref:GlcNAc-PI de-N-acetylase n=1 Tax=Zhengella mangrovi TaxID=1982044 RepID=A0A2G1QQL4_9HYPH|nr:hypothetical protein [Zhengella mangrovi]PHP67518.1 hypothetical protein CSC94_07370 [Zhengella mangrovi]